MYPYEILEDDLPFFNNPQTFTTTIRERDGFEMTLFDKDDTPMYNSPNTDFIPYQKFFACPCAEGYSRLTPESNEPCIHCAHYVENCHKCKKDGGDIKCVLCESEFYMLTDDGMTC